MSNPVATIPAPADSPLALNSGADYLDLQVAGTTRWRVFASGSTSINTPRDYGGAGSVAMGYGGALVVRNLADTVWLTMVAVVGGELRVGSAGYQSVHVEGSPLKTSGGRIAARVAVADANYVASIVAEAVVYTSLTASRTVTPPAGAAVLAGTRFVVEDDSGACSPDVTLTVVAGLGTNVLRAPWGRIVCRYSSTAWVCHATPVTSAVLAWGDNSISATSGTRYLTPWVGTGTAQTTSLALPMPCAGTVRNLQVLHNTPAGNGNTVVYTVQKNGVDTALTATLASTGSAAQDVVAAHAVTVARGDKISLKAAKALALGASPADVLVTLELTT